MRAGSAIPAGVIAAFFLAAAIGPALAPYGEGAIDIAHEFAPPGAGHVLGTGENGVDLLSALLRGARLAATVSLSVVSVSMILGVAIGMAAGWLGGWADRAAMAAMNVLLGFPAILLNMAIIALVARPSVVHVIFALSVNGWVGYARVARASTMSVRQEDWMRSARCLGLHPFRIALRHALPNIAAPLVIQATYGLGGVILAESSLSFLGLGPARTDSWGALLDQGTSYLMLNPWVAIASGAVMFACILSFNLVGDDLTERMSARSRPGARG